MKKLFPLLSCLLSVNSIASELHFESDRSLPLVYISIAMKGGSTQDPEGKTGLTDLMANLLPRGTKFKSKQQIDLMLDQLGGSLDTETRGEYTVIGGSVLAENIKPFLNLLEEIITSPSFRQDEFEKLKKEQISDVLDSLNNDQKLIRTKLDQIFFEGHPYGKPSKGKIKDIERITLNDLQVQYRKIFDQSRMLILSSGDTTESTLLEFQKKIDQKQNFKSEIDPILPFTNFPKGKKVVIIDKPDRTQTQISIVQKGTTFQDSQLDALQLANFAFGGGTFLSRLMVELRVKRGWTYGAGSAFKMGTKPHSWRVSFFPKNADTPAAIQEAIRLIKELKEKGLTQAEFDSAKKSMVNGAGFSFNTPAKRMENLRIEKIFNLPEGYHRDSAKRINALSLEEVNSALKKFIDPEQILIGVVGTASISKAPIAKQLGITEKEIEVVDYKF